MSQARLTSRAVLGRLIAAMGNATGAPWLENLTMYVSSDQLKEDYAWLGTAPTLREMIGGRKKNELRDFGFEIANLEFEATLAIKDRYMRLDKTGHIDVRINDFVTRANQHWAQLTSAPINNGESGICYDGQFFFDTDHEDGESGVQSNDLSVSAVSATAPTAVEMQDAILKLISQIMSYKDDQGEPINDDVTSFTVMTGTGLLPSMIKAIDQAVVSAGESNVLKDAAGFSIDKAVNPRLTATNKVYVFANAPEGQSAFVRQEEQEPEYSHLGEGSDHFFNEREHLFGLYSSRNVGYGLWQRAAVGTFA